MVRTLPIRLFPLEGEPLDSWLETLAHRSKTDVRDIAMAAGLPSDARKAFRFDFTTRLEDEEADRLSLATGIPADRLRAMTLGLYDEKAVSLIPDRRATHRARLWGRSTGSRYCPVCLVERDGRWLLRWRLTWSMACTRHMILLPHTCPACGQRPHTNARTYGMFSPGECSTRLTGRSRTGRYCCYDLTHAAAMNLPQHSPILAAQSWINEVLTDIERGRGDAAAQRAVFEDLAVLCAWLLRRAEPRDFISYGPEFDQARILHGAESRYAPIDTTVLAGPLTRAIEIRRDLDVASSLDAVATLVERDARSLSYFMAEHSGRRRPRSGHLQQVILQATDRYRDPGERLRYRTCTTLAAVPIPGDPRIPARVRSIPPLLWRDWAVLLAPPAGIRDNRQLRAALSMALLLPGWSRREFQPLITMLHGREPIKTHIISNLANAADGTAVLAAICILADYLDNQPAPIDYRRRRTLDGAILLPEQTWKAICNRTDTPIGAGPHREAVRRFLYQRITGVDLQTLRGPYGLRARTLDTIRLAQVPFLMSARLLSALDAHCTEFLREHGVDEPVTWSPPTRLVAELDLPGSKALELDIAQHLGEICQHAPSSAAKSLGVSIERLRLHFETQPPDTPWPAKRKSPTKPALNHRTRLSAEQVRTRADELLTREYLERERITLRKSIREIARDAGLHKSHVARRLDAVGLPRWRLGIAVDETWLVEQYVTEKRPAQNIATELGLSPTTVKRTLVRLGVELRPANERTVWPASALTTAPVLLQPALAHRGGLRRLRLFEQSMAFATLAEAAQALGIGLGVLSSSLTKLEGHLGFKLFDRSDWRNGLINRATPDGRVILSALSKLD